MRRLNPQNLLYGLLIYAFLFTVGYSIGSPDKEEDTYLFSVTVSIEKEKGVSDSGSNLLIDGKYQAKMHFKDENSLIFIAEGSITDAGVLLFGAKYISQNQPIKIHGSGAYFEGRIAEITRNALQSGEN